MKCPICGYSSKKTVELFVLKKYSMGLFQCESCRYLWEPNPTWLQEAYSAAINVVDTGVLQRNLYFKEKLLPLFFHSFNTKGKFLDFAGGYGIFTRLMRDSGLDFYWEDRYAENLLARGFEGPENASFEAITLFEFMEHALNPMVTIRHLFQLTDTVIFSTVLYEGDVPDKTWWYYGVEHGQHISFYTQKTLEVIANSCNKVLLSNGSLHIITERSRITKSFLSVFQRNRIEGKYAYSLLNVRQKIKYFLPFVLHFLSLEASKFVQLESLTLADYNNLKAI